MISIITVNLNNCDGLLATIRSVQKQAFKEFEHIIIDGGSTDGSVDVISENKGSFSFYVSEPDKGIFDAMNKGISRARGSYFLFLNSGDLLASEVVLVEVSPHLQNFDIVYGNVLLGKQNAAGYELVRPPSQIDLLYMYRQSIWHQSSFIKGSLFHIFGNYNTENKFSSDWEFFLKAILVNHASYKYIDVTVSIYDTRGITGDIANYDKMVSERTRTLQKYYPTECLEILSRCHDMQLELQRINRSRLYKLVKKVTLFKQKFIRMF